MLLIRPRHYHLTYVTDILCICTQLLHDVYMKAGGQCQVPCSVSFHLIFWDRISPPVWNSTIQLYRTGIQLDRKTPNHSVFTHQHWDYRHAQHVQLFNILGTWIQVFMFAQQAFCRLSVLPSLHFLNLHTLFFSNSHI